MGLPKKKTTRAKRDKRRSHHALKKVSLSKCPKCKKSILPHTACPFCGTYKGREVIKIKVKKTVKQKEKEAKRKRMEKK